MASASRTAPQSAPSDASEKSKIQPGARQNIGSRLPTKPPAQSFLRLESPAGSDHESSIPRPAERKPAKLRRKMPESEKLKQQGPLEALRSVTGPVNGVQPAKTLAARSFYSPNNSPDSPQSSGIQTPSLASTSSMSTQDSPTGNTLRRKPPIIANYMTLRRTKSSAPKEKQPPKSIPTVETPAPRLVDAPRKAAVQDVQSPPPSRPRAEDVAAQFYPPMRDGYMLPSVTPISNSSATPSLPRTDSPGAFSRGTTPTSKTSYSPLMSHSPHMGPYAWTSPVKTSRDMQRVNVDAEHGMPILQPEPFPARSTGRPEGSFMSRQRSAHPQANAVAMSGIAASAPYGVQTENFNEGRSRDLAPDYDPETADIPIAPPPELAHLVDDSNTPMPLQKGSPARPSREGTTRLHVPRDPSPVIISNLPRLYTIQHRRRSSSGGKEQRPGPSLTPTGTAISHPSRRLSRSQPAAARTPENAQAPSLPKRSIDVSRDDASPVLSSPETIPQVTKSGSRFGFWSRRAKTEPIPPVSSATNLTKKGPMAGTGYEAYAIKPVKRRSGGSASAKSVSSNSPTMGFIPTQGDGRKHSNSSTKNEAGVDDFYSQRLNPVYIRGDGSASDPQVPTRGAVRSRSQGTVSSEAANTSAMNSPQTSHTSYSSINGPQFPSKEFASTLSMQDIGATQQSKLTIMTEDGVRLTHPALISRTDQLSVTDKSPSIGYANDVESQSSISSELPRPQLIPAKSHEEEKAKRSKWSLFSKGNKSTQKVNVVQQPQILQRVETLSEATADERLNAEIAGADAVQAVAHYAMLPTSNDMEIEDIDQIMREAHAAGSEQSSEIVQLHNVSSREYEGLTPEQLESLHFPMFSPFMHESPVASVSSLSEVADFPSSRDIGKPGPTFMKISQSLPEPRPSRLPQVGRIPKVVSNRNRERKFPDGSFSRPFASPERRPSFESPAESHWYRGVTHRAQTEQIGQQEESLSQFATRPPLSQEATELDATTHDYTPPTTREFLAFPQRKDSDRSYNSSSSCGWLPSHAVTAVLPLVGSLPSEDEIWTEYDDLIDNVLTPTVSENSATPNYFGARSVESHGPPGPMVAGKSLASKSGVGSPVNVPHPLFSAETEPRYAPNYLSPNAQVLPQNSPSSIYSGKTASMHKTSASALPGQTLSTSTTKSSLKSPVRASFPSSAPMAASVPEIAAQVKLDRDSQEVRSSQCSAEERDVQSTPHSSGLRKADNMANLRFGALMTSKWLSFGRVLFSPGHNELSDQGDGRILVVDGLGKDWSYYCALSYPRATVYSLGPGPGGSPQRKSLGAWQSLPNHRHFSHPGLNSNFPFPKSFFAVVVFRFPTATSDATLKAAISECKRVLRPGGYIEVSSLDLDLTNMGNHARRAVRSLKTRMYSSIQDVSLKPSSDNIQRLLGRRGFENLNRCLVGVPAAGSISSSDDSRDGRNPSFAELVRDQSSESDDGITKMVARVGRWWYTKCYEAAVYPEADLTGSIWNDKELLQECEELQTTFKLLICYAQKPSVTRRRTVSL